MPWGRSQAWEKSVADHERPWRRCEERIPVGLGLCDRLRTNFAPPGRFSMNRLAPFGGEFFSNNARQRVGDRSRRQRDDDLDRPVRVTVLRRSCRGHSSCKRCSERTTLDSLLLWYMLALLIAVRLVEARLAPHLAKFPGKQHRCHEAAVLIFSVTDGQSGRLAPADLLLLG